MTDDWLKEIDNKKIVGAALLDFIDHSLLLKCVMLLFFTSDLPLALRKVCVSMYADNSTLYMSAPTAN
jgi:hypothetical protein